jgi:DNA-binding response OmpR family regulator
MPSRALRDALRVYLSTRGATAPSAPAGVEAHAHARIPSPTLALRGATRERTLRLTRSEHALIKVLLAAGKDKVASRASLKSALGRNTADQQLTQRLSVLRAKIDTALGVPEAIENIYGQGYQLIDADRYVLLDRAVSQ